MNYSDSIKAILLAAINDLSNGGDAGLPGSCAA